MVVAECLKWPSNRFVICGLINLAVVGSTLYRPCNQLSMCPRSAYRLTPHWKRLMPPRYEDSCRSTSHIIIIGGILRVVPRAWPVGAVEEGTAWLGCEGLVEAKISSIPRGRVPQHGTLYHSAITATREERGGTTAVLSLSYLCISVVEL